MCNKKLHLTMGQAALFQQTRFPNKPFWVYRCPECRYFHISTRPLDRRIFRQIAELIQAGQSEPLQSLSNNQKLHRVHHSIGTFIVKYNKKYKTAEILREEI